MQAISGGDDAEPRPYRRPRLANPHRVKLAFDIAAPEFQKAAQLRKIRGKIELLPDETLQQIGVIWKTVDDLRGRQSIIARRLIVVVHLCAFVRFALSGRTSMADRLGPRNRKIKA